MAPGARLVKDLTAAAVVRLGVLLLGLTFQILVAKAMQPAEYAVFSVALAGSVLFVSVASLGISRAISRFMPELVASGNRRIMADAAIRYVLYRFASLVSVSVLLLAILGAYPLIEDVLQGHNKYVVVLWFATIMLQTDAEALSQGLMEYNLWSAVSLGEMMLRIGLTTGLFLADRLEAETLILCWLVSSGISVIAIISLVVLRRDSYCRAKPSVQEVHSKSSLNPDVQRSFALGVYISSSGWLATSPSAVRLAGAAALPVVPPAAISFVHGIISSAQRALPIHLLAIAIEPVLITKSRVDGKMAESQKILGLLTKAETVLVLFGIVFIAPISSVILGVVARHEFAEYGYIIPVIMAQALGTSYYRVLEIVAGIKLKHQVFALITPISIACLVLVFFTTPQLGLVAALLWPSVDVVVRLAILRHMLDLRGAQRALDFRRLVPLYAAAMAILLVSYLTASSLELEGGGRFLLSLLSSVGFIVLLFILRPVRQAEYRLAMTAFPKLGPYMFKMLRYVTR
ncbi:oligosaccharide flippase family protein [Microvirga mediterraneensis]|uniref:Oligosaccharide flippase family protein n=1 Tax=Microvirga mediterraneensis TaxID=2754695 RepID=A0A838BPQ7_9HYPH|nr:oligosaccharide flippase family protein [Microvirga mediterraneensis]MBA1157005.1 oligosaccharide flippase family protein [Microvirga mediterraneensis]